VAAAEIPWLWLKLADAAPAGRLAGCCVCVHPLIRWYWCLTFKKVVEGEGAGAGVGAGAGAGACTVRCTSHMPDGQRATPKVCPTGAGGRGEPAATTEPRPISSVALHTKALNRDCHPSQCLPDGRRPQQRFRLAIFPN
jgi:hypothetical protein